MDVVTSAFLMRNVTDIRAALGEQRRIIQPGGRLLILEIPRPPSSIWGKIFRVYFHRVVPWVGSIISGQPDAYTYLPQSAESFLRPDQLAATMQSVGLQQVEYRTYMFGTIALHVGIK